MRTVDDDDRTERRNDIDDESTDDDTPVSGSAVRNQPEHRAHHVDDDEYDYVIDDDPALVVDIDLADYIHIRRADYDHLAAVVHNDPDNLYSTDDYVTAARLLVYHVDHNDDTARDV